MDYIAIVTFAYLHGVERFMASDCLKASLDMLPSPTLDGDGFIRFGILQGGGCDVPHRLPASWFLFIHIL